VQIRVEFEGYLRTVTGETGLDLTEVPEGANLVQLIDQLNRAYGQMPGQKLFNPRHEGYFAMTIEQNGLAVGDPAERDVILADGDVIRFTPIR
jgi:molybdopterin converting factor small subunit